MPATEPQAPKAQPPRPFTLAGASMRELLESCAAADAVSRPPRLPDPAPVRKRVDHPRAA
ncbi:hypothetical protein ACFY30_03225 [Streptomyces sp. NPDC000345]|uniref:hypothetical protein n=1 Tax=unclassified Streptomyces TaxID=2593676 RepID=UPI00368016D5